VKRCATALPLLDDVGDDVTAEIALRFRIGRIAAQLFEQELRLEHVDAHRSERMIGIAGDARRIGGLFDER
jgi:hypothetical protein